jgi:hypothetical protein
MRPMSGVNGSGKPGNLSEATAAGVLGGRAASTDGSVTSLASARRASRSPGRQPERVGQTRQCVGVGVAPTVALDGLDRGQVYPGPLRKELPGSIRPARKTRSRPPTELSAAALGTCTRGSLALSPPPARTEQKGAFWHFPR